MKVVDYIKEHGLDNLVENYSIKVREYDDLVVLNYNQIESIKDDPIVMECRGLILEKNSWQVVSRVFDRFFNHGECPDTQSHLDMNKATVFEKIDGSLIRFYYYKDKWHIGTRGTAYAEAETVWGSTFRTLVLKALGIDDDDFNHICRFVLNPNTTYIFEITSFENRVVKKYEGHTLHFLGARDNQTGQYFDYIEEWTNLKQLMDVERVKQFSFDTIEHCIETAKSLKDLDEGYVVYQGGVPICKIKSPTYLAVHRIKAEGLTSKRIMQLVLMNEQDEYLTYFPEDREHFTPYIAALTLLLDSIQFVWNNTEDIEDQKEFALNVVQYPFNACLFQARKSNHDPVKCFHSHHENYKMNLLGSFIQNTV